MAGSALVPEDRPDRDGAGQLEALTARAGEYVAAARATATRRAYQSDWGEFTAWAQPRGLQTMPAAPGTVARSAAYQAGR